MLIAPRRSSARRSGRATSRHPRRFRLETLEPRSLLAADPYISEFLAVNSGGLLDEDGEASDWIEIHNRGDSPADLTGWSLTDDTADLDKWVFPATTIPVDGRLIVFASDKDRATPDSALHTNFKLSGDGEYLALVAADGTTVVSQFGESFGRQRSNVSYGVASLEIVTPLVGPQAPGSYLVPTEAIDSQIGDTWTGGGAFDDSAWSAVSGGIGFDIATAAPTISGQIAYQVPGGLNGNQATSGSLGMDFVVTRPISVHSLGAFDDSSNGMGRNITVQLWSRNTGGTATYFADDTGGSILAIATFTPSSPGTLIGGSRFKSLASPVELQPGSYSIVANGYGVGERNGVAATGGSFGSLAQTEAIQFVGTSRFAPGTSTAYPTSVDIGPANRYGAGTFAFDDPAAVVPPAPPAPDAHVAYLTAPGVGTHTFAGNLGMDFQVDRPIRVTELGVFDSGQDGIKGAVGVSLWIRSQNNVTTQLAMLDFSAGEGRLEPGTGSRFLPLETPLILQPGTYTINATGFVGQDRYGQAQDAAPVNGTTDGANGAVRFVGSARFATDPNRFTFEPFHRYPNRVDTGPFNKWAAGTFKYEMPFDALFDTDVADTMADVNASAYVRIPFNVADSSAFEALRLRMSYDDGFVAYLNGVEIARRNAPEALAWNSGATAQRSNQEVFTPETIDVTAFLAALVPGENVLAIQGLNAFATNTDFAVRAELDAATSGPTEIRYFTAPTPGEANGEGVAGIVADTTFSLDRGIIAKTDRDANGQIHVEIATATPDAAIYYTTNGTEPSPENGTLYADPIAIGQTTTLRAAAYKDGFLPSDVDTQTYLFLEDVVYQSNAPQGLAPHWNGEPVDYGMTQIPADQRVIANDPNATSEEYEQVIVDSLLSLPSLSIVMDPEDLFGSAGGIYTNTYARGESWERAASIEYILPDGSEGFQTNAALQMMGWTSRIPGVSPKHTLRVVFKDEFGPGRLNFPFFDNGVDSYNTLALRSNSRDAWIGDNGGIQNAQGRESRPVASYMRDQWMRETEAAMGQPSVAGRYVHLYLNGQYWGLYNTTERPDAAFAEQHFGGAEEDYDVLRFCNPSPQLVDGSMDKWNELVALVDAGLSSMEAYQRIQGNNPDGTRNPAYEVLVDVDSLIDFMIGGYYHAAADWPCNWYAIRDRRDTSEGFKFLQWDGDIAFPFGDVVADVVNPEPFWASTPGRFEPALRHNYEFRLKVADHVQRHFYNGGALSPEAAASRWAEIGEMVRPALAAESARWGDYRRDIDPTFGGRTLYTRESYWDPFNEFMLNTFFPLRSSVVLDQLRYPALDAPVLSQHGGEVVPGTAVSISASAGTVYYTTDGSDPRGLSSGFVEGTATLVSENAAKRVFVPTPSNGGGTVGASWRGGQEPYDDNAWISGTGGVGYDLGVGPGAVDYNPLIGVNVQADMYNRASSVYIRIPFEVTESEANAFNQLTLRVRYDDGFVAYLNGVEIARSGATKNPSYNAVATSNRPDGDAILFQDIDVSKNLIDLRLGTNILAIHGLNAATNSSDLLVSAELAASRVHAGDPSANALLYSSDLVLGQSTILKARAFDGTTWSALTEAAFAVSNPLRVTELMYNPPGNAETTEFVEITNTGTQPVPLPGVRFIRADGDGIEYEFLAADAITELLPAQRMVIVNDLAAFAAAYPDLTGVLIAERPFVGNLSNGGEQLTLVDAQGGVIQQFTFDDAWQPTTDGDGFSLVIVDEGAAKATWNDAASWRASFAAGGSPGTPDVMPADVNADRQVNAADVLLVQAAMSAPNSPAERTDVDGDGQVTQADVDLVSQFLGASYLPPPRTSSGESSTRWTASTLPRPSAATPVFTPPPPTHGFSWVVDEWLSSLPDESSGLNSTDTPPTPAQAAPPAVVRSASAGGSLIQPIGGTTATGAPTGTLLAPPAQAAALVDRVFGTAGRAARVRSNDEAAILRPRASARRALDDGLDAVSRYATLAASATDATLPLEATAHRQRRSRDGVQTTARRLALSAFTRSEL
ncbi:MAG: hypothetical protein DCC68_19115 [Planctomycetota bacterium]|nr:MAG: hypothetical protein DCC68_19115 [Planctomycetota bacterium]